MCVWHLNNWLVLGSFQVEAPWGVENSPSREQSFTGPLPAGLEGLVMGEGRGILHCRKQIVLVLSSS